MFSGRVDGQSGSLVVGRQDGALLYDVVEYLAFRIISCLCLAQVGIHVDADCEVFRDGGIYVGAEIVAIVSTAIEHTFLIGVSQ